MLSSSSFLKRARRTHPERDPTDSLRPDGFVKPGVNPDILGAHLLLGELLDLLDSTGSLVLEPDTMEPFVHVDGIFPGHNLSHCGGSLLVSLDWHREARIVSLSCRSESSSNS